MNEQKQLTPIRPAKPVDVEIKDHIAYVRLNRPHKHNSLDEAMFETLLLAAKKIRRNRNVRAVVLSGNGPSFCSGLDFKSVAKKPLLIPRFFLKLPWHKANTFQQVAYIWQTLPMPVIAALHGNCFGGGLQIALGCDYRIAAKSTQLSIMESKWGLIPDMSGTVTLSKLTRIDTAFELTVTGRIFSGEEAQMLGIVSRTHPEPVAEATRMATQITQMSPDAVTAAKLLYQKTWKLDPRKALRWERWLQLKILGRFNQRLAAKNALNQACSQKPYRNRSSWFGLF